MVDPEDQKMLYEASKTVGKSKVEEARTAEGGQIGTLKQLIVFFSMLAIGIIVVARIYGSAGTPENAEFKSAYNNSQTQAADVFNFAPIVGLVMVAGLIIGVVTAFSGK
ncbi:MAG: hypothetical protein SV253_09090 [Halobacteria archaeon]|nr:hypothetical protein [Halobacteria archaeon]